MLQIKSPQQLHDQERDAGCRVDPSIRNLNDVLTFYAPGDNGFQSQLFPGCSLMKNMWPQHLDGYALFRSTVCRGVHQSVAATRQRREDFIPACDERSWVKQVLILPASAEVT